MATAVITTKHFKISRQLLWIVVSLLSSILIACASSHHGALDAHEDAGRDSVVDASATDGSAHDAGGDTDARSYDDAGLERDAAAIGDAGDADTAASFDVGQAQASGKAYDVYDRDLLAQPIIAPHDASLIRVGVRTTRTSKGGATYLSLYADDHGQPGALINRTDNFGLIANSSNRHDATSLQRGAVQLNEGVHYWIVAKFAVGATDRPQVFLDASSAAGAFRFGSEEPGIPTDLSAGATTASNGEISLFIEVRR